MRQTFDSGFDLAATRRGDQPTSATGATATHEPIGHGRGRSFPAHLVGAQLRWMVRPWMNPRTSPGFQRYLTGLLRWLVPQGHGVQTQRLTMDGRRCDRHVPQQAREDGAAIVYFHGGGYTVCSPDTHRSLARLLARESRMVVHVPSHRLAPEHPYPAQLDDAMASVAALESQGLDVSRTIFAGDSTGAHLALTLAIRRRHLALPLPRALMLISPCIDWTLTHLPTTSRDALLTNAWVTWTRDGYVPEVLRDTSLVSPTAADLHHLPPVLIQSTRQELFCDEARRLYNALQVAGGHVTWQEWQHLWHDFQMHAALLPEGRDAVRRMARFAHAASGPESSSRLRPGPAGRC